MLHGMTSISERRNVAPPWEGYVRKPLIIGMIAVVVVAMLAQAQETDKDKHDHRIFPCMEDGLSSGDTGCQLLSKMRISQLPDGPLFLHLNRFSAKEGAEAARVKNSLVAQAEGSWWLFSFGPKGAAPTQGEYVASIGPLPLTSAKLPQAKSYEVVAYLAVMPPGMYTKVHIHLVPRPGIFCPVNNV